MGIEGGWAGFGGYWLRSLGRRGNAGVVPTPGVVEARRSVKSVIWVRADVSAPHDGSQERQDARLLASGALVRRGRRVVQETVAQLGELDEQGRARAGALALRSRGGKSCTSCLRRRRDGASRLRCGWTISAWSAPAVLATCGSAGDCGAPLLWIVSARTVWSKAASGRRGRRSRRSW